MPSDHYLHDSSENKARKTNGKTGSGLSGALKHPHGNSALKESGRLPGSDQGLWGCFSTSEPLLVIIDDCVDRGMPGVPRDCDRFGIQSNLNTQWKSD